VRILRTAIDSELAATANEVNLEEPEDPTDKYS
jgi:hypothetical protein